MITKRVGKIKSTDMKDASLVTRIEKIYDEKKDEKKDENVSTGLLLFDVNKASGKAFRLVHDGTKAFIIEGDENTVTETILEIEEFVTEKEALKRVDELGLEYAKPENPPELVVGE